MLVSAGNDITEFGKMVEEYNYATNDRKKKVAPADTFRMYESKRTIKWENWMEPLLFWKTMTKKRIKDDGRIDLQIDGVEYSLSSHWQGWNLLEAIKILMYVHVL